MIIPNDFKDTIKYPTSLIVRGSEPLGIELAKSLLDQGGFVIIADSNDRENSLAIEELKKYKLFKFVDLFDLMELEEPLRRLDYIFYFSHSFEDLESQISSKDFLEYSRFLDLVLQLGKVFESKVLATTSVKSHQLNIGNRLIESDLEKNTSNSLYNAAEIQRYTESLVAEYAQKEALDTRVVRLGEIIGEGIEFSPNTTMGRMIKESITDSNLTIFGDGLESEYYIHLQDAVYGIIKAQFSKSTKGETFTLAYEYEISALSIAYKINDLADEPKEIKFSNKSNTDFSFRLYKPAPNLMRIGWKPRISFERALKQTYDFAKKYFALPKEGENVEGEKGENNKRGIISKIFFEDTEEETEEGGEFGALGRLIAERKSRDKERHGSILLANEHLAKRIKKESEATPKDRFVMFIRKKFDGFAKRYRWIKNLTIREFVFYLLGFLVFGYLYINVFSTFLSFGRNVFTVYTDINQLSRNLNTNNRPAITANINSIDKQLELGNEKVDSFDYLSFWTQYNQFASNYQSSYYFLKEIDSGISNVLKGSNDLNTFLTNFNPQIVYRPNSKSLLSVQNTNPVGDLNNIEVEKVMLKDGLSVLNDASANFDKFPLDYFGLKGSKVEESLNNLNSKITEFVSKYDGLYALGNVLLALKSGQTEKTFVFLIVDNGFATPAGGSPVGAMIVQTNGITLTSISLTTLEGEDLKLTNPSDYLVTNINLMTGIPVTKDNVSLEDLMLLSDGNIYLDSLAKEFSVREGKRVDGIFIINTTFLKNLLKVAGPSEFDKVKFDSDTLFVNLDLLAKESQNPTVYRKSIIGNIYAVSVREVLNSLSEKLFDLKGLISSSVNNKDIVYSIYMPGVKSNSLDNISKVSSDYIKIGLLSEKNTSENTNIEQEYSVNINVLIKDDLSTKKTVKVDLSKISNGKALIACLPSGSSNITFSEKIEDLKTIRFGEEESCIRFEIKDLKEVQFGYDGIAVANNVGTKYDYMFGLRKQSGTKVKYETTFTTETKNIKGTSEGPISEQVKSKSFTGDLVNDKIFGLNIN